MHCLGKRFILILLFVMLYAPVFSSEIVDRIIAVVNNDIITLAELNTALKPFLEKLETQGFPDEKKKQITYQLKQDMLSRLIDRKLTDQEAQRYNITISNQEVDAAIEKFKQAQSLTQEDLETALKHDGIDFAEYRERIKKELLRPKLINYTVKSKIIITDEDIKNYYDNHRTEFQGVQKYHLRNIIHDNKALMDELKIKLDNNESFTDLAAKYSQGKNAAQGGDLGEFGMDSLSDQIKESLKGLNVGDHTNVIPTDQGFLIFFVENLTTTEGKTFEQASAQIMEILYNQEAEKKFNAWLETLKKNAHIKNLL